MTMLIFFNIELNTFVILIITCNYIIVHTCTVMCIEICFVHLVIKLRKDVDFI